ncbi:extracellular solute-binding protein [Micromonospora sp. BRA006-A]|nr:extracellular solute-binding protein [Micromonospora sp. BRA006-A]
MAGIAAVALLGSAACGSGFDDSADDAKQSSGPADLQILIGSSGDAETKAVKDAAAAWAGSSGNSATVTPAQDLTQQLGQALAGGPAGRVLRRRGPLRRLRERRRAGAVRRQGEQPRRLLRACAPRSPTTASSTARRRTSTLALQINTDLWTKAGLTDADVPTTWDQLTAVSQKIKAKGQVAIALGDTRDRIGAFLVQNGGWLMSSDGKQPTADTPENLQALQYVKSLLTGGYAKFPKQLDSGWSGEAFGKGKAVMTIEGNWIRARCRTTSRTSSTRWCRCRPAEGPGHALLHPVLGHRRQVQVQGAGDQVRRGDDRRRAADRLRQGVRRDAVPPVGARPVHRRLPGGQAVHRRRRVRPEAR